MGLGSSIRAALILEDDVEGYSKRSGQGLEEPHDLA